MHWPDLSQTSKKGVMGTFCHCVEVSQMLLDLFWWTAWKMMDEATLVLKKDVSVGEYDARTGLTLITLQRGRLMFTMGPPSTKRAAAEAAARAAKSAVENEDLKPTRQLPVPAVANEGISPAPQATRQSLRVFRSGVFTGRSIYAEEAVYLVQRGALIVFELEELSTVEELQARGADTRKPLTQAKLLMMMTRAGHLKMAFLDVYAFLKDNKLHPRRHHVPTRATDDATVETRHANSSSHLNCVLDVYKSITETLFVTEEIKALHTEDAEAPAAELGGVTPSKPADAPLTRIKKRKLKRVVLVFRVVVRSFRDAMPPPRELRRLIEAARVETVGDDDDSRSSSHCIVPVKLAVANDDRSVVLFEVA